ncbi:hypothetical protein E2562_035365 [Oryza meyeriana var. granulata]|uniref:Uncharacterized protein n=1 Tax=Oryza meyeriana var. granulata TaxID=110450 RepID=A0A6G1E5T4_9ORYZ|nr:hypothetical protein E2562_035365 [Oryza meyeriana var. granulata]
MAGVRKITGNLGNAECSRFLRRPKHHGGGADDLGGGTRPRVGDGPGQREGGLAQGVAGDARSSAAFANTEATFTRCSKVMGRVEVAAARARPAARARSAAEHSTLLSIGGARGEGGGSAREGFLKGKGIGA